MNNRALSSAVSTRVTPQLTPPAQGYCFVTAFIFASEGRGVLRTKQQKRELTLPILSECSPWAIHTNFSAGIGGGTAPYGEIRGSLVPGLNALIGVAAPA